MTHDYDPMDDYEVYENVDPGIIYLVNGIKRNRLAQVCQALNLNPDFEIFFVEQNGLGGDVGKYIDGTSSRPVIGLDISLIMDFAVEHDDSWLMHTEATLVHELAHAFQDSAGLARNEKKAEAFAKKWVLENVADISILSKRHKKC
jgi:hypothetical protein